MKNLALITTMILAFLPPVAAQEEFNGALAGWANVKTRFGAKGDGKTDDTKAFQRALDQLADRTISYNSGKNAYTVVYIPSGTYCISSKLRLKGKIGISIIGEDPSTTIIKWIGKDSDTMFWSNGSAYFRLTRLSWNPNGRKSMEGVGIHWKEKWRGDSSRSYGTLNIEVSDCYFLPGFAVGLGGGSFQVGWTGANDSEISIRRCYFYECTEAGITIRGYNALDYWIWDCRFIKCQIGISTRHGNYHAYRCYFKESKAADFHNTNGYYHSVRWCYSDNSNTFSLDHGQSCNPFKRTYQGNIVVAPKELPVEYYHLGAMTLFDNEFGQGKSPKQPYTINQNSWCPGIYSLLGINNRFASKQPVRVAPTTKVVYELQQRSLQTYSNSAAKFITEQQQKPKKVQRLVYEVPRGAGSQAIQEIVNKASRMRKRAIVHFPTGDFTFDRTLVIPANSDIQILGDGFIYASVLIPSVQMRERKQPLIVVKGPSRISIKDLQLGQGGNKAIMPLLVFENVDQPGARAFIDQLYSLCDTSLYMKGNNHLVVQRESSFFAGGNYIEGGALQQQGKSNGRVTGYGGQFVRLHTEKNAIFIARDVWWEGGDRIPLDIKGSGRITIDGAMIAPSRPDSLTTVRINRFNGQVTLMNMYLQGGLEVARDNPNLQLFAWNINFYFKMNPVYFLQSKVPYKALLSGFTSQCMNPKTPKCSENPASFGEFKSNITDSDAFIMAMTNDDRSDRPMKYSQLAAGISNIFLSRISALQQGRAISFINTK